MFAQRGRDVVHDPAFDARTTRPAADRVVSTRGPIDIFPPHDLPSPNVIEPSSREISLRSSDEVASRPPDSAASTCFEALDSQRSPLAWSRAFSTSRISLRRSASATRSLAPAWATARVSRGKTNNVRRYGKVLDE